MGKHDEFYAALKNLQPNALAAMDRWKCGGRMADLCCELFGNTT